MCVKTLTGVMDRYVDGFVLVVPTDELEEYEAMAEAAGKLWMEHGALEYVESVGDDLSPDMGEVSVRRFPELADAGPDESVVFSYIVYESREHRDEVNERVMAEMGDQQQDEPMPFDVAKMAYGGFDEIVRFEA